MYQSLSSAILPVINMSLWNNVYLFVRVSGNRWHNTGKDTWKLFTHSLLQKTNNIFVNIITKTIIFEKIFYGITINSWTKQSSKISCFSPFKWSVQQKLRPMLLYIIWKLFSRRWTAKYLNFCLLKGQFTIYIKPLQG